VKARNIPNIITVLRILLVIPIMALLAEREYGAVLVLFAVAGLSDGADGFLARHYDWRTPLGAILDPLADKFMLVGVYLMLGWSGLVPFWLMLLVILRDAIIISGATAYRRLCGDLTMEPTLISKTNTLLQILLGLAVIVGAAGWSLPPWVITGMIALVALSTVWSGADYVWHWGQRAHACHAKEGK
jgi:cardiolipin synthase